MSHPYCEITHVQEFSASHRLHNPDLSGEENRRLYGICNNPNGHGHNWVVEVTVSGGVHPKTGMVMDLNRLHTIVMEQLILPVDHKHMNHDVPFLKDVIPTAENVAIAFWAQIDPHLKDFEGCQLHRIKVFESRHNCAEYRGPRTTRSPS